MTQPPVNTVIASQLVSWLGMEIGTEQPGIAVVQTVASGSAAEQAGVEPGDAILSIDGRTIHGAREIAGAIRGLAAGSQATLELGYGSVVSQARVTLGKPPSNGP